MAGPHVSMPRGRQFAMTWSIPEQYGGMTSALLHRSRAFVRLGGVPVDVLVFDPLLNTAAAQERLRTTGELIDGMRLLSPYDWFRGGPGSVRTSTAPDGTLLQIDHLRADGSLAVSDRREVLDSGSHRERVLEVWDQEGAPVRSFASAWSFYRFWLDELRAHQPSFFIVDSKSMAPFAATYRRKRAVMLHLVHASHLAGTDPDGPLRESRRAVFEHLDRFDAVVLLTHRQLADVQHRFGAAPNLAVIPNGRDLRQARRRSERPPGDGVVIASLTARKRVDHAIRAAAIAAGTAPGVSVQVFGAGESHDRLAALVRETGAPVVLRGYDPAAREHLGRASYLVQSAQSEGFPLVLVEAMASGCIPIAYDVPYGPSEVIRHGRNGILVPAGDVAALASAIVGVTRLPARQLARMRRAAQRSATRFGDLAVTRAWAREQQRAEDRKLAAWPDAPSPDARISARAVRRRRRSRWRSTASRIAARYWGVARR